ncbi:beta-lactamase family protein [Kibdelosporangium philippinense]|uniref:Beta-lactamase family protein n=1 Tax=Kibdelosporangium philippinense TaxID=211113 RepID=A0ABS8Z371_9PSEU|nr:serine hydrolase domain-containing protein [Kibdelosporangium philippinense]MCE7001240.1 beta-lactamase family protein [Kibdelosporangium philippinense]
MSEVDWLEAGAVRLRDAITRFVADGAAPGVIAVVGTPDDSRVVSAGVVATGLAEVPPTTTTWYDVASLTKLVATWVLAGDRELNLDKPVSSYLGSLTGPGSTITARQILAHTTGLRSTTRFDEYLHNGTDLAELIIREDLEAQPGERLKYINRGFILLGLVLERIHGFSLDVLARERFWQPWRMDSTCYGPLPAGPDVAPTERRLVGARPAWGVVHDESAALMGGVAGHAGVFSTVDDMARFARAAVEWVREDAYARDSFTVHATDGSTRRGLGWILVPEKEVAYHHGFTGTSLYLSPSTGRFIVVLSNAVFVSRDRQRLRVMRTEALRVMTETLP